MCHEILYVRVRVDWLIRQNAEESRVSFSTSANLKVFNLILARDQREVLPRQTAESDVSSRLQHLVTSQSFRGCG